MNNKLFNFLLQYRIVNNFLFGTFFVGGIAGYAFLSFCTSAWLCINITPVIGIPVALALLIAFIGGFAYIGCSWERYGDEYGGPNYNKSKINYTVFDFFRHIGDHITKGLRDLKTAYDEFGDTKTTDGISKKDKGSK